MAITMANFINHSCYLLAAMQDVLNEGTNSQRRVFVVGMEKMVNHSDSKIVADLITISMCDGVVEDQTSWVRGQYTFSPNSLDAAMKRRLGDDYAIASDDVVEDRLDSIDERIVSIMDNISDRDNRLLAVARKLAKIVEKSDEALKLITKIEKGC